jgi:hypothetical protein
LSLLQEYQFDLQQARQDKSPSAHQEKQGTLLLQQGRRNQVRRFHEAVAKKQNTNRSKQIYYASASLRQIFSAADQDESQARLSNGLGRGQESSHATPTKNSQQPRTSEGNPSTPETQQGEKGARSASCWRSKNTSTQRHQNSTSRPRTQPRTEIGNLTSDRLREKLENAQSERRTAQI